MPIHFTKGDATYPQGDGNKIIAHICNDVGAWGAGFVLAISKRWKLPEAAFRECNHSFNLGGVQFVPVEPEITVANIIAQHGISTVGGVPPIRYDALAVGLCQVAGFARKNNSSIHMPRIGCGLAGGTWDKVERIIASELSGLEVTVYDL